MEIVVAKTMYGKPVPLNEKAKALMNKRAAVDRSGRPFTHAAILCRPPDESFARFGQGSAGPIRLLESRQNASDSSEPKLGKSRVLAVMAEGDLVIRVNSREQPGPSKPPLIIFNLFRIQDGLIAEHWDAMSGLMPGQ